MITGRPSCDAVTRPESGAATPRATDPCGSSLQHIGRVRAQTTHPQPTAPPHSPEAAQAPERRHAYLERWRIFLRSERGEQASASAARDVDICQRAWAGEPFLQPQNPSLLPAGPGPAWPYPTPHFYQEARASPDSQTHPSLLSTGSGPARPTQILHFFIGGARPFQTPHFYWPDSSLLSARPSGVTPGVLFPSV